MADHPLDSDTVKLACLAADLSATLSSLQEKCGHDTTSNDISNIATELALLSQSLWRLHEAIAADAEQYTESFNQDLAEITKELRMVFEEIADCCEALQHADGERAGAVAWMFKKGRVHKLQKHLEALKSTIVVMRIVIWHGKDYGTHNSPGRLAESSPHTMHEDRAILESVFAKNRNAIVDVHMLDTPRHKHGFSSSSDRLANAGAHHRKLSTSTGVECPPLPDVLPPVSASADSTKPTAANKESPARRFSKRGVRLAVHSSILDMNAHDAPAQLKNKWIQTSRKQNHQRLASRSTDQVLSKISEVDSAPSNNNLRQVALAEPLSGDTLKEIINDAKINKPPLERNLPSTIVECPPEDDASRRMEEAFPKRRASLKMVTTPLRKMMNKLSISHENVEKAKEYGRLQVRSLQGEQLKTPDYEEEFENGV